MSEHSTLLLQLYAPLQSWGGPTSRWGHRRTLPHPTKSGVVGLLARCLGRSRTDDITDLEQLRMAVRIDRPGRIMVDQGTVGGGTIHRTGSQALVDGPQRVPWSVVREVRVDPRTGELVGKTDRTLLVVRHYLCDAGFLVSMSGDTPTLEAVTDALESPESIPYLGRSDCPASESLLLHLRSGDDGDAWLDTLPQPWWAQDPHPRAIIEDPAGEIRMPSVHRHVLQWTTSFARSRITHPPRPLPTAYAERRDHGHY